MAKAIMGRKQKTVDIDKLDRLCQYPLTNEDIAALLDVSVDTVSRVIKQEYGITFAEYKHQKQSSLRLTLLAKQIEVAKGGNIAMLIWLGKNLLGQSDKQEVGMSVSQIKIDKSDEKL